MVVSISALATLADPVASGVSGNDTVYLWIAITVGVLALAAALLFARSVLAADQGTAEMQHIASAIREVLKPLDSWEVTRHTTDAQTGSDHFDFLIEGLPTLIANQEEANYLPNYHAASDTLDKVDIRELKLNTTIAALTTWGLADRPNPLGKRLSRTEVEILLKETGLDQQMQSLGYWHDWEKGTRGRQQ